MAHFLRGKQAGVQRDLSASLGPEHFVLDDVRRHSQPVTQFELTVIVRPLWHQLPGICPRLRSRPIPPRSRHERVKIWGGACLCLWPEAGLRYLQASTKVFTSRTAVLRRQAHCPRQQE